MFCQLPNSVGMVSNSLCAENVPRCSDPAVRHESLWFDDGSIVLSLERTLFRVNPSILCVQSEIFTGMFSTPQPKSKTINEGCSIIRLSDRPAQQPRSDFASCVMYGLGPDRLPSFTKRSEVATCQNRRFSKVFASIRERWLRFWQVVTS
jgi:hypothetical protein